MDLNQWKDKRHVHPIVLGPGVKIGHAWVFERIAVFGTTQDVKALAAGVRSRRKMGAFIGKVKGVIPVDPHRVIYTHHTSTKAFKKRQAIKRSRRKLGVTRVEARHLKPLARWLR